MSTDPVEMIIMIIISLSYVHVFNRVMFSHDLN